MSSRELRDREVVQPKDGRPVVVIHDHEATRPGILERKGDVVYERRYLKETRYPADAVRVEE
jgi:hypothetical protein